MGLVRVTMQREGKGVHVTSSIEPIDHLRPQRSPFAFSGNVLMRAGLIKWNCHDLQVMARQHVCQDALSVSRTDDFPSSVPAGIQAALQAATGNCKPMRRTRYLLSSFLWRHKLDCGGPTAR